MVDGGFFFCSVVSGKLLTLGVDLMWVCLNFFSQACLLKAPSGNGGLLIFFETTQGITFLPARLNSNTEMEKVRTPLSR